MPSGRIADDYAVPTATSTLRARACRSISAFTCRPKGERRVRSRRPVLDPRHAPRRPASTVRRARRLRYRLFATAGHVRSAAHDVSQRARARLRRDGPDRTLESRVRAAGGASRARGRRGAGPIAVVTRSGSSCATTAAASPWRSTRQLRADDRAALLVDAPALAQRRGRRHARRACGARAKPKMPAPGRGAARPRREDARPEAPLRERRAPAAAVSRRGTERRDVRPRLLLGRGEEVLAAGRRVLSTAVGYAGGPTPNPTYREVCSGLTGHTEVVQVVFDPRSSATASCCEIFWESHDPDAGDAARATTSARSTARRSTRTATRNARQPIASRDAYARALADAGHGAITTEIAPAPEFFFAEDYHQQYLAKNPDGYCGLGGTGVSCPIGVGVGALGLSLPAAPRTSRLAVCRQKEPSRRRSATCAPENARRPRRASSCGKRSSTCARASTARARASRRSRSDCRRRAAPACRYSHLGPERRASEPGGRPCAIWRPARDAGSRAARRRNEAAPASAASSARADRPPRARPCRVRRSAPAAPDRRRRR